MATPEPRRVTAARCSDADRNMVADLLNTAYTDGRITLDEHAERLEAVWQAKTFGDLEQLTADLTLTSPVALYTSPAPTSVKIDPLNAINHTESLSCFMGDLKRSGEWRLRRHTKSWTFMGDTVLDLRQATFDAAQSHLTVTVIMGDVLIMIPEGVNVLDQTTKIMGDSVTEGLRPGSTGGPIIELSGMVIMGDVKVFGPDSRRVHKLDRKQRRQEQKEQRRLHGR